MSQRDELIHRLLTGEATPEELDRALALQESDSELDALLREYREDEAALLRLPDPEPPPALRGQILAAVEQERRPRRVYGFRALAMAASVAFVVGVALTWGLSAAPDAKAPPADDAASTDDSTVAAPEPPLARPHHPVPVRFVYVSTSARDVQLVGDFDGWGEQRITLQPGGTPGLFHVTIALPPGEHEYMFVIDGEQWVPDPLAERSRDDGFGQANSVITI